MNPASLARRGSHLARSLQPVVMHTRRASTVTPVGCVPLRDGTLMRPLVLSREDRPRVAEFFETLDPVTLSEAHGSYCAMFSGVQGDTEDSARSSMIRRFELAMEDAHVAVALVGAEGASALAALSFHRPTAPGAALIYNLTVHQDFTGRGAAVALVRTQLAMARSSGQMRVIVPISSWQDHDGVGEHARSVIAIMRRAAELSGMPMQFNESSGQVVIEL